MVTVINFSVNSAPKKSRVVFFLECDVTKEKSFGIENTRILIAADTSSNFTVHLTNRIRLLEQTTIEKIVIKFVFDAFRLTC